MPRRTNPEKCPVCSHPDRNKIDRLLTQDIPYPDISLLYPELTARDFQTHNYEHLRKANIQAAQETVEVTKLMPTSPDEVAAYGFQLLYDSLNRLQAVTSQTGSIKAEEVLLRGLDVLLRYEERMRSATSQEPSVDIRVTLAVPPTQDDPIVPIGTDG